MTGPANRGDAAARSRPRRRRPAGRVPVGRLAGFPIFVSPSWFVLAAVLTAGYGRLLDRAATTPVSYALAGAFVGGLVGTVLLHELGHALVCRRYGVGVRAVTLEMLGGYTEMDRDAPTPAAEALIALAGPGVSVCVGGLVAGIAAVLPPHTAAHLLAVQLAASNLLIAGFNALPGLPLDGGRALLALVWARTGDPYRGNLVAGLAGWLVAAACLAGASLLAVRGGPALLAAAALAVVSVAVGHGAGQAVRLGRIGARLPRLDVSALARPVYRVAPHTPVGDAHRAAAAAGLPDAILAVADPAGRVLALVGPGVFAPGRPVGDVARRVGDRVLPPGLRGIDVLHALRGDPRGDYLVASGEDVVGVLRGADVAMLLTSRETTR